MRNKLPLEAKEPTALSNSTVTDTALEVAQETQAPPPGAKVVALQPVVPEIEASQDAAVNAMLALFVADPPGPVAVMAAVDDAVTFTGEVPLHKFEIVEPLTVMLHDVALLAAHVKLTKPPGAAILGCAQLIAAVGAGPVGAINTEAVGDTVCPISSVIVAV